MSRRRRLRHCDPGEYSDHLFRRPFSRPVVDLCEDVGDRYLLGDWAGSRSQLVHGGISRCDRQIKPIVFSESRLTTDSSERRPAGFDASV
jgi:hypothetical protein